MKPWNYKNLIPALALMSASTAFAQTMPVSPMVAIGGGVETGVGRSGYNVLLRVEGGMGIGGSPCSLTDAICQARASQMVIMHVAGDVALDPSRDGVAVVNYMNIRFTPLNVPVAPQTTVQIEEWIGRYGIDRDFRISALPARVQRDPRLRRELSVRVTAIGIEGSVRTFPADFLGLFVEASVDLLGYRYLNQDNLGATGGHAHAFSFGEGRVEAGILFTPNESILIRLSGGAAYESSLDVTTGSGARAIHDIEAFAQASVSITRLVQLFGRVSYRALLHDGFVPNDYVQVMGGLSVHFDW